MHKPQWPIPLFVPHLCHAHITCEHLLVSTSFKWLMAEYSAQSISTSWSQTKRVARASVQESLAAAALGTETLGTAPS